MLDRSIRRRIDPFLDRVGRWLAGRGVGADTVTAVGFVVGIAGAGALACRLYVVALVLILLSRLLDGLDGAVARAVGPTDRGGFLDIVADFIFYAAVPFGFAVGQPDHAIAAGFLILSFVGTGSSFLAFAALAAKRGFDPSIYGRGKAIVYLGGLTEGTETIAVFALICLFPAAFPWVAYGFGALCWLTTATRVWIGWRTLGH